MFGIMFERFWGHGRELFRGVFGQALWRASRTKSSSLSTPLTRTSQGHEKIGSHLLIYYLRNHTSRNLNKQEAPPKPGFGGSTNEKPAFVF